MSHGIKVTFGNSGRGPITDPTHASQMFNAQGNWKCGVVLNPGVPLVVINDLQFDKFMGLQQSAKAQVVFGAADANHNFTHAAEDQIQMQIYKQPRPGFADVVSSPMLRFEAQEPNQHCVFEFHSDKKTPG